MLKWAILLNLFNVLDAVLTYIALHYFGAHEANPIMRWLIEQSPWLALAIKLGVGISITIVSYRKNEVKSLRTGALIFIAICVWNSAVILMKMLRS